jgi:TATA-box binding protein (TBP) (component of TFIID and TFIIIB)
VSTAYVGGNIDLLQLYDFLMKRGICDAVYTPELFPGLRLSAKSLSDSLPNVKVLIFSVGNVVITGGKNLKELDKTWDFVKQILDNFRTESRIEHRTIISNLKQSRLSQSSHDL